MSELTQQYIQELEELRPTYEQNSEVTDGLGEKSQIIVIGSVATGKSTLQNELQKRYGIMRTGTILTREQRPDDDDTFTHIPFTDEGIQSILTKVQAGELVQYVVHPTTGNVYASALADYPGKINSMDTLPIEVDNIRKLPFKQTFSVAIVAEPDVWQGRALQRFDAVDDPDLQKRLIEGDSNLTWSLQDKQTVWIENQEGQIERAAKEIYEFTQGIMPPEQDFRREMAHRLLERIKELQL